MFSASILFCSDVKKITDLNSIIVQISPIGAVQGL